MKMKILHFTAFSDAEMPLWQHLDALTTRMGEHAVVNVVTLDNVATSMSNYNHFTIGTGKSDYGRHGVVNLLGLQKKYLHILYGFMPDIVHIHGSYNFIASRIGLWSRKRGFPVVFSSYGGMNPDFIDAQYGIRTWKMICYQKKMVANAAAMLLTDPKEADYLKGEKLNDRIVVISDPKTDEYTDYEEMAQETLALYQQVLDSDMGTKLDQNSREAISALLHLSLAGPEERQPLCAEDILNLRSLSPKKWHDLLLYAEEQGVTNIVLDGMERAQVKVPVPDLSTISHFPPRHAKDTSPLPSQSLLGSKKKSNRFSKKIQDCGDIEKTVCFMMQNLKYHAARHSITLRHLCDLYTVYRHEPVNDNVLDTKLHDLHLHTFARRISQILKETVYLAEGFMPVTALDDHGTEKIRKSLVRY